MPWTGRNDGGSQAYTPQQKARVLHELRAHVGIDSPTSSEELARLTGVNGRALRHIFGDIDGVDLVLGFAGRDKLFVCACEAEAQEFTGRLASQAAKMQFRVHRRESYWQRQAQGTLDLGSEA